MIKTQQKVCITHGAHYGCPVVHSEKSHDHLRAQPLHGGLNAF